MNRLIVVKKLEQFFLFKSWLSQIEFVSPRDTLFGSELKNEKIYTLNTLFKYKAAQASTIIIQKFKLMRALS